MESAAMQAEGQTEANTAASPQNVVLHILSPSPQAPHRFTFEEIPLSTKVSEIKARITLAIPNRPDPESQRLIYRGKVLSDSQETLENIVDSLETRVHSIHLVLPPNAVTNGTHAFETSTRPPSLTSSQNLSQNSTGLRYRGPQYEEPGDRLTNFLRDCNEELDGTASALPDSFQRPATASNTTQPIPSQSQPRFGASETAAASGSFQGGNATQPQPSPYGFFARSNSIHHQSQQDQPPDPSHSSFLLQRITTMEDAVRSGIAPEADHISQVRFQLLRLLDERYRHPHERRDTPLESWFARISTVAVRADRLRRGVSNTRVNSVQANTTTTASNASHNPMYLLSSPNGHHGIVMPSNVPSTNNSRNMARSNNLNPGVPTVGRIRRPQLPTAPAIRMRYRPEGPTAQRVRRVVLTGADLSMVLGGLWLFARLSFFCYLLTQHGSWTRILLFVLSAMVAVASQTRLPQLAQTTLWDPVRRHLERLVTLDVPRPRRAARGTHNAEGRRVPNTPTPNQDLPGADIRLPTPEHTNTSVVRRSIMSAERAIVLFLATLIPGIGERYVATRNAADAARRDEELRRQAQREDEQQQQDGSAPGHAPDIQDDAVTANPQGEPSGPRQENTDEITNNQNEHQYEHH